MKIPVARLRIGGHPVGKPATSSTRTPQRTVDRRRACGPK
jgi:hypothetical protein